jgi:hypothetical protein
VAAWTVLGGAGAYGADPFMVVALPDTQFLSANANGGTTAMFTAQTQWIANNLATSNIAFVSHVGDVVNTATNVSEYNNAVSAMNLLGTGSGSLVPYSVVPGNHDMGSAANYLTYFGPSRYSGASWYGGSSPSQLSSFETFSEAGYNFLHIGLEVDSSANTPAAALSWAQGVINNHPGWPTIISTHNNMNVAAKGTNGTYIWDNFIKNNSQVFMVLSGHYHGENQQLSVNTAGGKVIEMLADFQDGPNGGSGFLRQMTFDPNAGQIRVQTYSPYYNQYYTDLRSQFTYNVTFGPSSITVNGMAPPPAPTLRGWWKLDETSGTTLYDSSNGWTKGWIAPAPTLVRNNGVLTGTNAALVAGAGRDGGAAVRLQPASNSDHPYVRLTGSGTGNAAANLGEQTFTLAAWIKRTGTGYTASTGTGGLTAVPIVAKGVGESDNSNVDANFIMGIDSNNHLCADFETYSVTNPVNPTGSSNSGTNFPITGNATLVVDNNWHHVAATWDGSGWSLYVDGVLDGTKNWNLTSPNAPSFPRYDSIQLAAIGTALSSNGTASGNFYGFIDDVRIYEGALGLSDIQALAAVPEPASLGILAVGAAALLRRRRMQRR